MLSEREPGLADASRRTWLAAERTWLAGWRSGIAVGAVALAVGRFLSEVTKGAHWPFRVVGIAYGALSVVILVLGAVRQRRSSQALRRGEFEELTPALVTWLTAGAVALSIGAMALVVAEL